MTTANDIQQLLSNIGLTALGIESPRLAIRWVVGADPSEGAAATMSLTSSDEWVAPAAGVFIKAGGTAGITLPDGSPAPTTAAVLRRVSSGSDPAGTPDRLRDRGSHR